MHGFVLSALTLLCVSSWTFVDALPASDAVQNQTPAFDVRDSGDIFERSLVERAGPSGQLLQPVGDTWVYSEVSWPGSGFHFVYNPAYVRSTDSNCVNHRDACYAATRWLEVSLVSDYDPSIVYKLADYLHVSVTNPSANIDTWLGVPQAAACGNYRVRVIEHQRYFNQWISFQSAAPLIHMQCVRYAGPTK